LRTPKVSLYIRVRRPDGKHSFLHPVWNGNRTLRTGYALVQGQAERHAEYVYYLRYRRAKKRTWEAVGSDADAALVALKNRQHDLQGQSLGRSAPEPVPQVDVPVALKDAINSYLADVRRFRAAKTIAACERILGAFESRLPDCTLDSITRDDLLDHMAALREDGLGPRTVYNHLMRVKSFLRSRGIVGLLKKEDIPSYDEPEVEAYDPDQLDALFAAANSEEQLLFQFFLVTGFRDQEVMFCTWKNVDFRGKVIKVLSKPELGFRPKDKEERSVPVPDALITLLAARKKQSVSPFVFPGTNGKPNRHLLRVLKQLALRAGLNCGECTSKPRKTKGGKPKPLKSCRTHAVCGDWGLHKFRKTFATMHNEALVPVTTIQRWLGHSDLATTLRYLAIGDLRSERTRQQVNATFAGLRECFPDASTLST